MNVEDVLEQTLTERAKHSPPGGEVLQRVLAPSRVSRRWWPAAVSVVAAAAVVAAALVALGGDDRQAVAPAPSVAASPTWSTDGLAAYGPTRTLVYRGVELQVPASWPTVRDPACGGGGQDAVVVDELLARSADLCWTNHSRVAAGHTQPRHLPPRGMDEVTPIEVDGSPALVQLMSGYVCVKKGRPCLNYGTLNLTQRRVTIVVQTHDRVLTQAILASVHLRDMSDVLVPDLRGVPAHAAERRLIRLGLSPRSDMGNGFVFRSSPTADSPAPADGVIELTIARVHFQPGVHG